METDFSDKITQTKSKIFNVSKEKQKMQINPIELYSSQSNTNIKSNKLQLVPLSLLFTNKLNNNQIDNNTNEIINFDMNKRLKSVNKANLTLNEKKITNSLFTHNALSHKRIQIPNSNLKLPKIKCYNGNNDLQSRLINSILNKFEQYDNKFKQQGKLSSSIIKRAEMDLKLTKEFFSEEGNKINYLSSKNGYKRKYSKIYRRIKKIQAM